MLHGNGYMSVYPTRKQLLLKEYQDKVSSEEEQRREHLELMEAFSKLQETMETQDADRNSEREEFRRQLDAAREEQRLQLEAERAEHKCQVEELLKAREADKEALKQELLIMMKGAQGQAEFQQVLVIYY